MSIEFIQPGGVGVGDLSLLLLGNPFPFKHPAQDLPGTGPCGLSVGVIRPKHHIIDAYEGPIRDSGIVFREVHEHVRTEEITGYLILLKEEPSGITTLTIQIVHPSQLIRDPAYFELDQRYL